MTYCRYEMKQERIYNQISPCSKRLIYFFNFQDENSDEDVDDVDDDVEEESKSSSVDSNVEKTDKTEVEVGLKIVHVGTRMVRQRPETEKTANLMF